MENSSTQSKFHIGQKVRVVSGVKDPDYGFPIGGWSGCIEDIELSIDGINSCTYNIHWDAKTVRSMDEELYEKCEEDGFDATRMFLAEYELEAE